MDLPGRPAAVGAARDPAASITLDKLPGAFQVEALSARIFGFSTWSVLLPQVVETVLAVLVLYRVVRRWMGPVAGLVAAAAFATTPIVAALAHALTQWVTGNCAAVGDSALGVAGLYDCRTR